MKKVIYVLVSMLLVVNASAAVWTGSSTVGGLTAGDGTSWFDLDNWATDALWATDPVYADATALPASGEMALLLGNPYGAAYGYGPVVDYPSFSPGSDSVVVDAPGAVAGSVFVGAGTYGHLALNVTSAGTLSASTLYLGAGAPYCAVNNEGAINVSGDLYFWAGATLEEAATFNMNGGTMDIGGVFDFSNGTFAKAHLDGGTVEAASLAFDPYYQDNLDITDGVLILDGDVTGQVVWNEETGQPDLNQSWGLAWWTTSVPFDLDTENENWRSLMTAYDGAGTIMYSYDSNTNQTTIWAVPEPATIMLLGLGGAALLRRRKK